MVISSPDVTLEELGEHEPCAHRVDEEVLPLDRDADDRRELDPALGGGFANGSRGGHYCP